MKRNKLLEHRMLGVTLVELLTVILVIAILSSISVASYRRYAIRANRTDGTSTLLRIQVAEEKHFLSNNSYTIDFINPTTNVPPGLGVLGSATTNGGYYNITVAAGPTGIGTSYVATATAIAGQTDDTAACQVFTINDQGARTPADSTGCWK